MAEQFEALLKAWRADPSKNQLGPGATEAAVAVAEAVLRRRFPRALRDLYFQTDGCALLEGNLNITPLATVPGTPGLVDLSDELRGNGWAVPDELLVFGDDGQGNQLGIWLPSGTPDDLPNPIVMLGVIFGRAECMAVFGSELLRFLHSWTIYYTLLDAAAETPRQRVLDLLGVPAGWRDREPDDALFAEILRANDPDLPTYDPDPYVRGVSAQHLRTLYGRSEADR